MIALAVVPLVVGIAAALLARPVANRLAPAAASILLTSLALTVALATGVVLGLAAIVGAAELPALAWFGHRSPDVLRDNIPMPPMVGALGGLIAIGLLGSATVYAVGVIRRARAVSVAAAAVPTTSALVLVEDRAVFAYAVPGRHRRIVTSTGMLKTLSGPQRRAVLAHEEAHLRYRHHLYVQLGRLAAAANPLMRPVSASIDLAVERWADEIAAREVGDRLTVARALAAAALAPAAAPVGVLAAAGSHVVDRVDALLTPQRHRSSVGAAVGVGVVACWLAAVVVVLRVHGLMELAEFIH